MQAEFDLEVDWRGFELHPEIPRGGMPVTDLFPAARLDSMRAYIERFAQDFEVAMGAPEWLPNTRLSLAVGEWAREQGLLTPWREQAMIAYWRDGLNLERDADLRTIAERAGLDPQAAVTASSDARWLASIDRMRSEASERGVTGIPTFFFGDYPVVGCQPYETLALVARKSGFAAREILSQPADGPGA